MIRSSKAIWKGTGKEGKGKLTSTSGVLKDTPYTFHTRFV
ncbi:MAG: OsmC family peroxiredoxin, partial [Flavobacteriales bacterium]|nr:OsmC family peroxiredoxin [Flavobacteriales bacterium]